MRITALTLGICVGIGVTASLAHADPADSVVKVTAFTRFPLPTRPWEKGQPVEGSGSGVFIGGNRILTNAHVVNYASEVYVQWRPADEKTEAKVEAISVDLDLAILTISDAKFFAKHKPMAIAKHLPKLNKGVTVYGFPRGGAGLSITKGEVSRINAVNYGSEGTGLQIQISAAVNPGNSGGPAIVDEQMTGLVYSTLAGAQNIGYIIPAEEIQYFVTHTQKGRFKGKPRVNTQTKYQALENEALRRMLGIDRSVQGVLIYGATPDVPLKNNDIVTKIGNHPLDNRGNVQLEQDVSVFFMYMVFKSAQGNTVPITVRRNGKLVELKVPVQYDDPFLIPRYRGAPLPYFIHGPLVFVPARSEDVSTFHLRWNLHPSESPLSLRRNDYVRFPGEELVVVGAQFRHKIAKGYVNPTGYVVGAINGTPIKNMRHLVETVRDNRDPFLKIQFAEKSANLMVFDRQEAERATAEVLDEQLGISAGRRASADLMNVWKKKNH